MRLPVVRRFAAPPAAVLLVLLLLLLLLSSYCHGLANNNNPIQTAREAAKEVREFLSTVQGPGYNSLSSPPPLSASAAALLQDLDLQASTEPVLAKVQRAQQIPNLLTASLPAIFRLGSGIFADGYQIQLVDRDDAKYAYLASDKKQTLETGVFKVDNVEQPIIIYEFESCPFCRKVREACSMLSLPVTFRPCPKDGPTFRPEIKIKYGSKVSTIVQRMIGTTTPPRLVSFF
jgi:ABC-type multidrug transport system fused ATPase/permease subunit